MVRIRLNLLGGVRVSRADGTEVSITTKKGQALIAYMALHGPRQHPREELAALLWGDRFDQQARHSLRQCILELRKILADEDASILSSSGEFLTLSSEAISVDALELQNLALEGSPASLERAVKLYAGELLAGLRIQSDTFDEWISVERVRYRDLAVDASARLIRYQTEVGNIESAVGTAKQLLDIDPTNEDAHRALMCLYSASGKRAAALRQYRIYVSLLRREFAAEPDPVMSRLYSEICSCDEQNIEIPKSDRFYSPVLKYLSPRSKGEELVRAQSDSIGENSISVVRPSTQPRAVTYWAVAGVMLALVASVIVVAATFWRIPELAPAPIGAYVREIKQAIGPHSLSIAILPFESHGDPDAEEFANALSEGITAALSISSEMSVISRSSVRNYSSNPTTIRNVAQDLEVRYILEGGVRKWGKEIYIEVGLIDTEEGQHRVWTENYQRQAGNFISLQQDITFEIITSLEVRLTEGEQERINRTHGTQSLDAWLAASQGEKHLRRLTEKDTSIAHTYYKRAISIDPDYPGAWDGLGWIYLIRARFGWTPSREQAVHNAKEMAERALALDRERPRTYSLLGGISLLTGNFGQAVDFGEKAVSLGPNDADAAALLAYTLTYTGEPERAIALIDRAIKLRPHPPRWYRWLFGRANRLAGRFQIAVDVLSAESQATSYSFIPAVELAMTYSQMKEPFLAKRIGAEVVRKFPQFRIRSWIAMPPFEDSTSRNREVDALRLAGLPE